MLLIERLSAAGRVASLPGDPASPLTRPPSPNSYGRAARVFPQLCVNSREATRRPQTSTWRDPMKTSQLRKLPRTSREGHYKRVERVRRDLNLEDRRDTVVRALSGGQQKWVNISRTANRVISPMMPRRPAFVLHPGQLVCPQTPPAQERNSCGPRSCLSGPGPV